MHFIFIAPMHSYATDVLVYSLHMTIFSRVYSYVTRVYSYVTRMYSYVTRMYSCVFVCYSHVTRMLLVCSFSHNRLGQPFLWQVFVTFCMTSNLQKQFFGSGYYIFTEITLTDTPAFQ